jgi:hypothetical protein
LNYNLNRQSKLAVEFGKLAWTPYKMMATVIMHYSFIKISYSILFENPFITPMFLIGLAEYISSRDYVLDMILAIG